MKGTSKLPSRHLSADRPLQRLRGCFLGDNAAMPPAYRVKVQKCASFVDINLQHFVTERGIQADVNRYMFLKQPIVCESSSTDGKGKENNYSLTTVL